MSTEDLLIHEAPVDELRLEVLDAQSLKEETVSLLPESARGGESLYLVLERISARFGPDRVLQPTLGDDHTDPSG